MHNMDYSTEVTVIIGRASPNMMDAFARALSESFRQSPLISLFQYNYAACIYNLVMFIKISCIVFSWLLEILPTT